MVAYEIFKIILLLLVGVSSILYLLNLTAHSFKNVYINPNTSLVLSWCGLVFVLSVNTKFEYIGVAAYVIAILLFIKDHIKKFLITRQEKRKNVGNTNTDI